MSKKIIVAVDCGQVVTQASVFELTGLSLRLLDQTAAPTTAGAAEGLAAGVRSALTVLERRSGIKLLDQSGLPLAATGPGTPLSWAITADCGGPLRVAVAGVIDDISGQSAVKAVLGAGAAVADLFAVNDGRGEHQKVRDLRQNPVDLIVLAGGVDEGLFAGGGGRQVVNMAATLATAKPRPRYDPRARMAVVFAGSAEARLDVQASLEEFAEVVHADNVRPDLAFENLSGAKKAVLDLFRSRVVSGSPVYRALAPYAEIAPPLPTGMATGTAFAVLAGAWKEDLLAVDLGEVSVGVFTVIDGELNRTVSDELGINLGGTGPAADLAEAAERWIPLEIAREEIANTYSLQRLRPAAVPLTWRELLVQHAVARERVRGALDGHRRLVSMLMGIHRQRNIDEVLGSYVAVGGQTIVNLLRIGRIVVTGRLVGTATAPGQVAAMVLDGLQPQGLTQILSDRRNLLAHLGAVAELDSALAAQMLGDDWLSPLALVVAPVPPERGGPFIRRYGGRIARVRVEREDGSVVRETVDYGMIKRIPLGENEIARVTVWPNGQYNVGSGFGLARTVSGGGQLGVILDGRGRPIMLPQNQARRRARVASWLGALGAYPGDLLQVDGRGEGS